MKLIFWGTFDLGRPRTRILMQGLTLNGIMLEHQHYDLWEGILDKSQLSGLRHWSRLVVRALLHYPGLLYRFARTANPNAVIVAYLGQLDILILWPLAKLRGVPIIWDVYLSLYGTVVQERRLISERHPVARLLYWWEWLACRAADAVILDTATHARYFIDAFELDPKKVFSVFIGTEPEAFLPKMEDPPSLNAESAITVLFYGQFIPAHGLATIIEAARLLSNEPVHWVLIGEGHDSPKVRAMLDEQPLDNLTWISWVAYDQLTHWISQADLCLGIFGTTPRATNVIPNKVFQILACGRRLITRDSPAIRELLPDPIENVELIEAGNPRALADAILASNRTSVIRNRTARRMLIRQIYPQGIGQRFASIIDTVIHAQHTAASTSPGNND